MLGERQNYGGISATSPNQARMIRAMGKNGPFERARIEASAFLLGIAPKHKPSKNAPDNWRELLNWSMNNSYYPSELSAELVLIYPLPVFDGGGQTVYTSKAANLAYRAWHDYTHLKLNASFELDDEKRVAQAHLKEAKKRGLSRGARWLLWIDSQGQNEYFKTHNEFVNNQYAFCKACFENGIKATLASGVKY